MKIFPLETIWSKWNDGVNKQAMRSFMIYFNFGLLGDRMDDRMEVIKWRMEVEKKNREKDE